MGQDDAARSDAASPEARVGALVRNKWRIDELLGVGGMACVYSATHVNGRRAALKILHPELARDATVRERFLREGQIGNKIPHPGRVEVLDHDVTDEGEPFLVMELLHGETLDALWKRNDRKLPVQTALAVAEQLLDFLGACHSVGIIHRDLKPANVFICDDPSGAEVGRVKVLDYGIAQLRDAQSTEHTRAGTTLGTPSYMSPEQARGSGEKLDGRADIFSVGALLHALLTGERLHQGRTNDEALILAATQPAPSIARLDPDLPHSVIALVDKALQWDRRNRWENAGQMREAVLHALDEIERPSSLSRVASVRPAFESAPVATPERASSIPPDGDLQLARARGWFKTLERLLPSVRQYGWSHPETERRLHQLFEETLVAHSESPDTIAWSVRPYSFARGERDLWEPSAPLDVVPYAFFESGIREMRIAPGVTEAELRALLELFLLDPIRDLPPEDDLATLLWELGLPHVRVQAVEGIVDGDATEREAFFAQSDPLERLATHAAKAARAEARAMTIATERSALEITDDPVAETLGIDRTHRLALGAQLVLPLARWSERWVDVLADAYVETCAAGDAELVLAPLRESVRDLAATGQARLATAVHAGVMEALTARATPNELATMRQEVTDALFGGDALASLLAAIAATPRASPDRAAWVAESTPIFAHLGPAHLPRVLEALAANEVEELHGAMLRHVERCIEGNEHLVAARVGQVPQDLARELLAILGRHPTTDSATALADVAASGDLALRVEAIAQRAESPEKLRQELGALAEHPRQEVRLAALRAIGERRVRDLGPWLVRRIEDLGYHALSVDERREILHALHALHPARAEALAIEILSQRSVLRGDAREQSRLVAAKLLGDHARTREALDALNGAAKGWWGTSSELRALAMEAAQQVAGRVEPSRTGTGERGR